MWQITGGSFGPAGEARREVLALRQHRDASERALSETRHRIQQLEREVTETRAQLETATDALARCTLLLLVQCWRLCKLAADCWGRVSSVLAVQHIQTADASLLASSHRQSAADCWGRVSSILAVQHMTHTDGRAVHICTTVSRLVQLTFPIHCFNFTKYDHHIRKESHAS